MLGVMADVTRILSAIEQGEPQVIFSLEVKEDQTVAEPPPGGNATHGETIDSPAERDFVLAPWLALDPDAELPGRGRVSDLLARLRETS